MTILDGRIVTPAGASVEFADRRLLLPRGVKLAFVAPVFELMDWTGAMGVSNALEEFGKVRASGIWKLNPLTEVGCL
jgi:hypothetical protein